jgi:hypothetical protein
LVPFGTAIDIPKLHGVPQALFCGAVEIFADYFLRYLVGGVIIVGMIQQTLIGHIVTLSSARGPIRRTIIGEVGDVLIVAEPSSEQNVNNAEITRYSIGFNKSDVLAVEGIDNSVSLKHNVHYEQAERATASENPDDAV